MVQKPTSSTQFQVKFSETTYDDLYNKRDRMATYSNQIARNAQEAYNLVKKQKEK